MNTTTFTPATDKQISYAFKLGVQLGYHTADEEADFTAKIWAGIKDKHDQCSKATFSKMISAMIDLINKGNGAAPKPRTDIADVPAGYYALVHPTENKIYFFKVDRPTEGKWAGHTFVKRISGDNELRVDRTDVPHILRMIAANPLEAAKRYGHETGVCGMCHRRLTDPKSVAAGIGPVCADKF